MRKSMIGCLLLSAGSVLAGCQPMSAPVGTSPGGQGGLEGTVTLGPACPGPRVAEIPCADRPYKTGLSVKTPQGALLAHVMTDANGAYRVVLAAGSYLIVPDRPAGGFPHAAEVNVTVKANSFTRLDIVYDTGIR